jgi:hypothetical protein
MARQLLSSLQKCGRYYLRSSRACKYLTSPPPLTEKISNGRLSRDQSPASAFLRYDRDARRLGWRPSGVNAEDGLRTCSTGAIYIATHPLKQCSLCQLSEMGSGRWRSSCGALIGWP